MTGSVALDVVIGLAFMYLLYSLFATIIMEIITSWLGLRARNLKYSLKRMLIDDEYMLDKPYMRNKIVAVIWGFILTIKDLIGIGNVENKKGNLLNAFYNQPSIKYLGNGGVFSKPSYLTAANFSKALLDSLKQDQVGQTLLSQIQNGINSIKSEDTKQHIQSLLEDANNDLQKFKLLLENWFEDTQERSMGWFRRNNKVWLLLIGLLMAISFDASTLKMARKLSYDENAREQLVRIASSYVENNKQLPTRKDTLAYEDNLEILNAQKKEIQEQLNEAHSILGSNTVDINITWKPSSWIKAFCTFWCILISDFWGYFLTALAISLGAPFWFDLLNKLVKLRGSVQQPARSKKAEGTGPDQSILDVKA